MIEAYKIAVKEIGIKEVPGEKNNPRIVEYHSKTSLKSLLDDVAWCSAFVNWCLFKASQKGTNLANARSFITWGVYVENPELGDICVFWRGNPQGMQGHVGFYAGQNLTHIIVLGGNQNNEVCYQSYPKNQLLQFRRLPPNNPKGDV